MFDAMHKIFCWYSCHRRVGAMWTSSSLSRRNRWWTRAQGITINNQPLHSPVVVVVAIKRQDMISHHHHVMLYDDSSPGYYNMVPRCLSVAIVRCDIMKWGDFWHHMLLSKQTCYCLHHCMIWYETDKGVCWQLWCCHSHFVVVVNIAWHE